MNFLRRLYLMFHVKHLQRRISACDLELKFAWWTGNTKVYQRQARLMRAYLQRRAWLTLQLNEGK